MSHTGLITEDINEYSGQSYVPTNGLCLSEIDYCAEQYYIPTHVIDDTMIDIQIISFIRKLDIPFKFKQTEKFNCIYYGLNSSTGRVIIDYDHIVQSVCDIINTPIGSRLERREYGSALPYFIDAPFNEITRLQAMSAIVMALIHWEPRIRVTKVNIYQGNQAWKAWIDIESIIVIDGIATNEAISFVIN